MTTQTTERVNRAVRAGLKGRGMTQADAGQALGLSQQAIARRLNGEVAFNTDEIELIAQLLEVSVPALMKSELCNCEHVNHGVDLYGRPAPLRGHRPMAALAGSRRADHVGAICDACAADCLAEYLLPLALVGGSR